MNLRPVGKRCQPVKFLGFTSAGSLAFRGANDYCVESIGEAIAAFGEDALTDWHRHRFNEPYHAGENDGLFGKAFSPRTVVSHGAPRALSEDENASYCAGYVRGVFMATRIG